MPDLAELERLLKDGATQMVAPAISLCLWQGNGPLAALAAGRAAPDTIFDLASLTKPLASAPLALDLIAATPLDWDTTLDEFYGRAVPEDKKAVTIRQLLAHSSGLPAYRPYFQALDKQPSPIMRMGLIKAMLLNEPLEAAPGSRALYSDLGYLLLGIMLAEAGGEGLEEARARMQASLGVDGPRYLPLDAPMPWPLERIAPSGPLPGRAEIHGQVEDENAFALGGVAGHAGLFGTARQTAALMAALVRAAGGDGPWPAKEAARLFRVDRDTPGSARTPGFDTPSGTESAAGNNAPADTVGHLGFTGASLWWSPSANAGAVLLTNRVAHGRDNDLIHAFRRRVHTAAWRVLGLAA